jgi:hypothetical protein
MPLVTLARSVAFFLAILIEQPDYSSFPRSTMKATEK